MEQDKYKFRIELLSCTCLLLFFLEIYISFDPLCFLKTSFCLLCPISMKCMFCFVLFFSLFLFCFLIAWVGRDTSFTFPLPMTSNNQTESLVAGTVVMEKSRSTRWRGCLVLANTTSLLQLEQEKKSLNPMGWRSVLWHNQNQHSKKYLWGRLWFCSVSTWGIFFMLHWIGPILLQTLQLKIGQCY